MQLKTCFAAVLTAATLAGCGASQQAAAPAATPSAPAPIASTRQVMLGLTIPASDVLFQLGDKAPATQAEWDRVVGTAAMLAESGNMLLVAPRNVDQPEWQKFAQALVAQSKDAMAAAEKKDVDAVLEIGNSIYETCDGCHQKYMPARVAEQTEAAKAGP